MWSYEQTNQDQGITNFMDITYNIPIHQDGMIFIFI